MDGAADTGTAVAPAAAAPSPEQIAAAEEQVVQQADAVRQLKGLGLGNSHPEVQSHVQVSHTTVAYVWAQSSCSHACTPVALSFAGFLWCDLLSRRQPLRPLRMRWAPPALYVTGTDQVEGRSATDGGAGSCS